MERVSLRYLLVCLAPCTEVSGEMPPCSCLDLEVHLQGVRGCSTCRAICAVLPKAGQPSGEMWLFSPSMEPSWDKPPIRWWELWLLGGWAGFNVLSWNKRLAQTSLGKQQPERWVCSDRLAPARGWNDRWQMMVMWHKVPATLSWSPVRPLGKSTFSLLNDYDILYCPPPVCFKRKHPPNLSICAQASSLKAGDEEEHQRFPLTISGRLDNDEVPLGFVPVQFMAIITMMMLMMMISGERNHVCMEL